MNTVRAAPVRVMPPTTEPTEFYILALDVEVAA